MRNKWLLALDVDRTILTDDYRLLNEVRQAIQDARKLGVTVSLATARGPVALEVILKDLGEVDYAICFGGALVLKRAGSEWAAITDGASLGSTIDPDAGRILVELCRSYGVSVAGYGRDKVFVEEIDSRLQNEIRHTGDRYEVRTLGDISEPLFKYLVISRTDEVGKLAEISAQMSARLSCATSHVNYLEVGPLGTSKGTGLALLARAIGIDQQHTVAIGDGENDLPMFLWAGISIAMGNALEHVREAADWTTTTNAEAGVAAAINRLTEQTWHAVASE
ncbi:MAG: Cof-type HAD-IIB family hydrolase [Shinella sp.]|nr:Cof-type HAD-IIB family hydrolase [Shinella sp.]